ncbi:MAG: hypothetical protein WBB24_04590 [Maribacter sp.]
MNHDQIKLILNHQARIILDLIAAVEYLKNFPKYLEYIDEKEPKALWFINNSIRDITIINLTQLFHGKEHYSFNRIRQSLKADSDFNIDLLDKFDAAIKPGNKLFKQLKVLRIRNQHVGHILSNRSNASVDWVMIDRLIWVARNVHDLVFLEICNTQNYWCFDQNIMSEIFSNDLQSRETYKVWRKMFHEGQETLERSELEKLIKINWP